MAHQEEPRPEYTTYLDTVIGIHLHVTSPSTLNDPDMPVVEYVVVKQK